MTDSMATTMEEAEERAALAAQLTPSEKALAKIVAAVAEWASAPTDWKTSLQPFKAVLGVAVYLPEYVADEGGPTDAGAALLDRARKAGVL